MRLVLWESLLQGNLLVLCSVGCSHLCTSTVPSFPTFLPLPTTIGFQSMPTTVRPILPHEYSNFIRGAYTHVSSCSLSLSLHNLVKLKSSPSPRCTQWKFDVPEPNASRPFLARWIKYFKTRYADFRRFLGHLPTLLNFFRDVARVCGIKFYGVVVLTALRAYLNRCKSPLLSSV